jgi:hypothetical protein
LESSYRKDRKALATPLRLKLKSLRKDRSRLDKEIVALERQYAKVTSEPKLESKSGSRMKRAEKVAAMKKAVAYLKRHPKGTTRSALAAHLGFTVASSTSTVIKALQVAKQIKSEGKRKKTLWLAA